MSEPRLRTIRIKTGVVNRLAKEKVTYEREAIHQKERIQQFKDQGKDSHDIKKQEEVLQESLMMVPDCQRRLQRAFDELTKILETEQDLRPSGAYILAEKALEEAESQLP